MTNLIKHKMNNFCVRRNNLAQFLLSLSLLTLILQIYLLIYLTELFLSLKRHIFIKLLLNFKKLIYNLQYLQYLQYFHYYSIYFLKNFLTIKN
jgi:hypothetical protein